MSSDFESARNRSHGELDRPSFVAALKASGALQFGTFTLASGKTSSYYVDIKKAITRPDLLRRIAKAMAPYARGASRIAGVELGADLRSVIVHRRTLETLSAISPRSVDTSRHGCAERGEWIRSPSPARTDRASRRRSRSRSSPASSETRSERTRSSPGFWCGVR